MTRLIAILAASLGLVLTAGAGGADGIPDKTVLEWWYEANSWCRGSSGVESDDWCEVREALAPILDRRDWCYGREGEYGYQNEWHRCGPHSIRRPK